MHRLVWATSFAIASAISISNPTFAQSSKPKEVTLREIFGVQTEREIKVTRVEDLDDITIRFGDKQTHVRLASVAPFHEWPVAQDAAWVKMQEELKQQAVNQLLDKKFRIRLALCQEEGKFPAVYLDERADYLIDRESMWEGLKPAERTGWGRTSQNIDLVFQGLTIYRPNCADRPFDMEELFERAQQNAEVFRRGLWKEYRFARAVELIDTKVRH
ncbi:hypothetical protein LOC68_15035 [Blastopirellula sp. JC732]|uniref:TNase-like domain-containing protein n=1 Tax=Blastopirellula sediminis TaxID=2894196 RepID=A0A9X1MMW1_9BACT|nr:hypothetical protein [Blastopirellula sediminis]MCC9606999.1 hypothetical protein [Blastopirellula sediminis]MCC9629706.1 hypothetical protein [Blastopirellula sediminis]